MPGQSHFNFFNKETRDLFMLRIVFMCQLNRVLFIIVVHCLTFIHSFLLISFLAFHLFIVHCSKEVDSILVTDRRNGGQPGCPGKCKRCRKKNMNSNTYVMYIHVYPVSFNVVMFACEKPPR
jgi:hypothetical protein